MSVKDYLITVVLLLLSVAVVEGGVVCFRKYRIKHRSCSGPIRKGSFSDPDDCCANKGLGYASKRKRVGRNKYTCEPCTTLDIIGKPKPVQKPGSLVCYRKYNSRKDLCGGRVRKGHYSTAEECCSTKGSGYATFIVEQEANKYICSSCSSLSVIASTSTATTTDRPTEASITNEPVSGWGSWGSCSATCGAGWRSRYRVCDNCDMHDYFNVLTEPCMLVSYCPVDGSWGPWYPWQQCTISCGGGLRIRQRQCNYPPPTSGGKDCVGVGQEKSDCNMHECPVHGGFSEWSQFTPCSATCGQGDMTRSRQCNNPPPAFGGKDCQGMRYQRKRCEHRKCPVDGAWSLWGPWGTCPVTCGDGIRTRYRTCDSPKPLYGGEDCAGSPTDTTECHSRQPCPVDGGWTSWSGYGPCRAVRCSSIKDYQYRSRSCTNPRPRHGGRHCHGRQAERLACLNDEGCPVPGRWCDWEEWSSCSSSCEGKEAVKVRHRSCECPAPKNDAPACEGNNSEAKHCEDLPVCPGVRILTRVQCRKVESEDGSGDGSNVSCEEEDEFEPILSET